MNEKIKQYWEERAAKNSNNSSATTGDIWLRELEIITLIKTLKEIGLLKNSNVLDVGCGDGYSTLKIAKAFHGINFTGIDYSKNMIKTATTMLKKNPNLIENVRFLVGDILELEKHFTNSYFDVIISDRCLINLDSLDLQKVAIEKISKLVKKNGYYIAIENFVEGHENMNKARSHVGLQEIPIRWHNLFFKEKEFQKIVENFFRIISWKNFSSSYYFATRVVYSKMCEMKQVEPDYNHEIHQLSIKLPCTGNFSPIRMIILQKYKENTT